MSAPLDFLKLFAGKLREANIRFAITSGMACVYYGLQQTTKDSDWIIPAEDLIKVRELLERLERELPPWRVAYRPIFGAPLDAAFMAHGWTSHVSVWDRAESPEHHVDIFSTPPRVNLAELAFDEPGFASRHIVAQMKKTDRDNELSQIQPPIEEMLP